VEGCTTKRIGKNGKKEAEMPESIANKTAIIGMGCTRFGERWEAGPMDLVTEAAEECFEDAGIEPKEIQAAWFGAVYPYSGMGGLPLAVTLRLPWIPVTHVSNYCATGTEALRAACYAVAAGVYDVALALGVEKLKDAGYGGLPGSGASSLGNTIFPGLEGNVSPNITMPGMFAMLATRYFSQYRLSPEEGKRTLAKISAKSHHNGALNPKAHLRREVTVDEIMKAPIIAWPLGMYDCCGVSDGSAAAIVTRADMARKFRPDAVYIKSLQIAISAGYELSYTDWDYAHVETTYRAGIKAYQEAGIKNPREEISLMETHDCFSITELTEYEDLQISPRGQAKEDIDAGFYDLDGAVPCQPDGGLKCFGHPVGASGLRMVYELYKQFQGKAGVRQIKNPKMGLTQNMGGTPPGCIIGITILGL
jgi:acetyl-CoA C-acetyltransferase